MLTCVTGSFIISTSVTFPNIPKYSLSFSLDVCQLSPPTKSFPGAGSATLLGVLRPEELEWLPLIFTIDWWRSWSMSPLPSAIAVLEQKPTIKYRKRMQLLFFSLQVLPIVVIVAFTFSNYLWYFPYWIATRPEKPLYM